MIFEISTLEFVKNGSLTQTVNFSVGSAFSDDPGSAFSEGPGPSPCSLYKVCHEVLLCFAVIVACFVFDTEVAVDFAVETFPSSVIISVVCLVGGLAEDKFFEDLYCM